MSDVMIALSKPMHDWDQIDVETVLHGEEMSFLCMCCDTRFEVVLDLFPALRPRDCDDLFVKSISLCSDECHLKYIWPSYARSEALPDQPGEDVIYRVRGKVFPNTTATSRFKPAHLLLALAVWFYERRDYYDNLIFAPRGSLSGHLTHNHLVQRDALVSEKEMQGNVRLNKVMRQLVLGLADDSSE